jgi:hypothetical protein
VLDRAEQVGQRATDRRTPVLEGLRLAQALDAGVRDQLPQPVLALGQAQDAGIIAIELHEIERPLQQAVLGALGRSAMQNLEAIGVNELGVENRRLESSLARSATRRGNTRRPVGAVADVKRYRRVGPMHLHETAVEFHLIVLAYARRQPLAERQPR